MWRPGQPGGGRGPLFAFGAVPGSERVPGAGEAPGSRSSRVLLAAAGCPLSAGAGRDPSEPVPVPLSRRGRGVSGCLRLLPGLFDPLLVRALVVLGEGVSLPGNAIVPGEPAGPCCPSRVRNGNGLRGEGLGSGSHRSVESFRSEEI